MGNAKQRPMVPSRCASTLVVPTVGFALVANAQTEKTFPTDAEINLVLTQTERAIQQYKPLIDLEAKLRRCVHVDLHRK